MRQILLALMLISLAASPAQAQNDKRKAAFNVDKNFLGIDGYDPVAYFTEGKAVKGNTAHNINHQGIVYRFSSETNKNLFRTDPAKYEPQYGGWCAYAMGAKGEKVEVDPETFKIVNGKLYLFYNRFFNNTLKSWNKNEKELNTKADANWNKIFH